MDDDRLKQLIKTTVSETLIQLGVDGEHPLEVQKDMHYLRKMRTTSNGIIKKALWTLVGTGVSGVLLLVWQGLTAIL